MLMSLASQGRLSNGEQQREASELGTLLAKQSFTSLTEDLENRRQKQVKDLNEMWLSGFKEGLKRKVTLIDTPHGWQYKLTFGSGRRSIYSNCCYFCPNKALQAANRKIGSFYTNLDLTK
jgi:hypothetical protein